MKIIKFDEDQIVFDNGTIVSHYHDQDCCEYVFADFNQLQDTDAIDHEFNEKIKIENVPSAGFRIEGYFIPCYNQQNGYYSSDLFLIIEYPDGKKVERDISSLVKDEIY
jgi:hypothetical protein